MKGKKSRFSSIVGTVILFVTVMVFVSISIVIYVTVEDACNGNSAIIAVVMIAVIVAFSAFCTVVDVFRRRYMVDKPVQKILDATDKIATGDFTVRLEIKHMFNRYDEFDYIMENLNKMTAALSRTEVLHNDFIANVSHEIKTPLSIIQNYVTVLQDCNLTEDEKKEYMSTLVVTTKRLSLLVSNILKLNKLENQEIKNEYEIVNLSEQLAETVLDFEEPIEEKGLELECDFDEDVKVYASPSYLDIVWNNLLSNAVKFTVKGGKIMVSLKKENGRAIVKVADTGCGISAETGKHIFEKFYQGDTSHSQEGNGLGLALVKKVVDITGGTIHVNSELGVGTTFTVALKSEG